MKKEIEAIYSKATFSHLDMIRIPKEEIQGFINSQLASSMVKFITYNIEELPIEIISSDNPNIDAQEFILKLIVISKNELSRLQMIEAKYKNLCTILNKQIKEE